MEVVCKNELVECWSLAYCTTGGWLDVCVIIEKCRGRELAGLRRRGGCEFDQDIGLASGWTQLNWLTGEFKRKHFL